MSAVGTKYSEDQIARWLAIFNEPGGCGDDYAAAQIIEQLRAERDEARRECDKAQARASRLAELDPDGELQDDDMQEALREIESLTVSNVRLEAELSEARAQLKAAKEEIQQFRDNLSIAYRD